MGKILIVGKNSSLFSSITAGLEFDYDACSSSDFHTLDVSRYECVIMFAISNYYVENISLIDRCLKSCNLIYIGSVASQLPHRCYSEYPKLKNCIEQHVLKNQRGCVVQVGVTDRNLLKAMYNQTAFTSAEKLARVLNDLVAAFEPGLVIAFDIMRCGKGISKYINYFERNISPIIAKFPLLNYLIVRFCRSLDIEISSYTSSVSTYYCDKIQVGFGAIGSNLGQSDTDLVLVSHFKDAIISTQGFQRSRLGFYRTGLGKYWHGAHVKKIHGSWKKFVKLRVRRRSLPVSSEYLHVDALQRSNGIWIISGTDLSGSTKKYYSKQIVLSCGAMQACILISNLTGNSYRLSEHKIGFVGYITKDSNSELINECIQEFGPFVRRKACKVIDDPVSFLLDLRPVRSQDELCDNSFFDRETKSIIMKLITSLSIDKLNQAIFNKFGFGLKGKFYAAFVQALDEACIKVEKNIISMNTQLDEEKIRKSLNDLGVDVAEFELVASHHFFADNQNANKIMTDVDQYCGLKLATTIFEHKMGSLHPTVPAIEKHGN